MRGPLFVSLAAAIAVAVAVPSGAQQVRAGAEFQANSYSTGIQRLPDVHIKPNGDFIVAWTGQNSTLDSAAYGVFAQRFNVTGVAQGAEFRVNTHTPSFQFRPVIASDARSNFVVA